MVTYGGINRLREVIRRNRAMAHLRLLALRLIKSPDTRVMLRIDILPMIALGTGPLVPVAIWLNWPHPWNELIAQVIVFFCVTATGYLMGFAARVVVTPTHLVIYNAFERYKIPRQSITGLVAVEKATVAVSVHGAGRVPIGAFLPGDGRPYIGSRRWRATLRRLESLGRILDEAPVRGPMSSVEHRVRYANITVAILVAIGFVIAFVLVHIG